MEILIKKVTINICFSKSYLFFEKHFTTYFRHLIFFKETFDLIFARKIINQIFVVVVVVVVVIVGGDDDGSLLSLLAIFCYNKINMMKNLNFTTRKQ